PQQGTLSHFPFLFPLLLRYTDGKPVLGRVQATLCRLREQKLRGVCVHLTGQTESDGCLSWEVGTPPFHLTRSGYQMNLEAMASLEEKGTGVVINATRSCLINIVSEIATVTFEEADAAYRAGIPYTGKMLLKAADGSALKNETLRLFVSSGDISENQTFLTDESGRASFALDTSSWTETVALRVNLAQGHFKQAGPRTESDGDSPHYPDAHHSVEPFYSRNRSFLKIGSLGGELPCDQAQRLHVDYVLARKNLGNGSKSLDFIFLLLVSVGSVSLSSQLLLPVKGQCNIPTLGRSPAPVQPQPSDAAKVLGYTVLPNGEMAADSALLHVAKCLPNKVKLAFSQDRALPGSELQLQVQAAPGSLCAVRAVDRSVLLMKPEAELSVDTSIIENIVTSKTTTWSGRVGLGEGDVHTCIAEHHPTRSGFVFHPKKTPNHEEVHGLTQDAALTLLTNTRICEHERGADTRELRDPPSPQSTMGSPHPPFGSLLGFGWETELGPCAQAEPAPHTYFPETWLWDLVAVGDGGSTDVPLSVPDTLTQWKAGMFCTAEGGFGLSPTATLTVVKPFFVELALPYSVVRGEAFTLKATVSNSLQQCIKVRVMLAKSAQFQVQASDDGAYTSCLCADEGKTFQWEVTASSLGEVNFTVSTEALRTEELCGNELAVVPAQGRVDTVIQPLLVLPGGIVEETSHSSLLCQEASEEISLQLPANVLAGSERAHVTVLGDIMGAALQNIEHLQPMFFDDGEQNMVRFALNIYIQQYLEKSGQLSPEIRDKAQGFLQSRYQRQLHYKHKDSSYSAFGESDSTGNTWLTAFVLKSFGQARPYISIDEKHLKDALGWLQHHQLESGCFRIVGKLMNNTLQGNIMDEISLSAYVTAALLELGQPLTDPTVTRALQCLQESSRTSDLYTRALLAYAFGLAGRTELRDALLQSLAQHSISAGGQLHWRRQVKGLPSPESHRNHMVEVELTAYVLLAHLSLPNVSAADLATASQIARWLSKQENLYKVTLLPQNTVVALQALARYAALTYSASGTVSVTVSSPAGARQQFHVENANRLELQRAALQEIPGQYTVQASGSGCVFVQLILCYNVPPPKSAATFELRVETEPKECSEGAASRFSLALHARYRGERSATNMAIIEAKLPSGYVPAKSSLGQLEKQPLVKRLEVQKDQVTIYLDQLTKEAANFTFSLEHDFPVKNLRAAPVRLYDYYGPGESRLGPAVPLFWGGCATLSGDGGGSH
uniref:Alpha-2-macroglobulin like 1 n=1 Tax=Pelodiscus sinensis TaxID=13735 RepID=K7FSP2_PELSI